MFLDRLVRLDLLKQFMMLELVVVSQSVGSCGSCQRCKLLLLLGIYKVICCIILNQVYGLVNVRGTHIACTRNIFAKTAIISAEMRRTVSSVLLGYKLFL